MFTADTVHFAPVTFFTFCRFYTFILYTAYAAVIAPVTYCTGSVIVFRTRQFVRGSCTFREWRAAYTFELITIGTAFTAFTI